jgi:hypothetical protein
VIVVHAGCRVDAPGRAVPRFPASRVEAVAADVGAVLERLQPDGVITAAAAGADLLVIEEAMTQGIPVHMVLPFARARFREESVADLGRRWTLSYDRALARVAADPRSSIQELDLPATDDGFRAGNQALLDRAFEMKDRDVVAVAVRPPGGEATPSVTDDFVSRAKAAELPVVEVDPTDSGASSATP